MNLEQLQRKMCAAVMQPLTPEEGMRLRDADGRDVEAIASEFIQPNARLTAFERLEIYNRQYWFRLQSALQEDFPALRAVVGAKRFDGLADAYLVAHPSRSFTLRNLGSSMVSWLAGNPQWAGIRLAVALDVARVEWACIEAFDNAEWAPLTVEEAAAIDGDSRLSLQPHVQLLSLDYPADDLVLEMHQRQKRERSEAGSRPNVVDQSAAPRLRLRKRATCLAVHRSDLSIYYKRLTQSEFRTLSALQDGATLSEALEVGFSGSRASVANRAASVRAWFANWSELRWLCKPALATADLLSDGGM